MKENFSVILVVKVGHFDSRSWVCMAICLSGPIRWNKSFLWSFLTCLLFQPFGRCLPSPNTERSIQPKDLTFAKYARKHLIEYPHWFLIEKHILAKNHIDVIYVQKRFIKKVKKIVTSILIYFIFRSGEHKTLTSNKGYDYI